MSGIDKGVERRYLLYTVGSTIYYNHSREQFHYIYQNNSNFRNTC